MNITTLIFDLDGTLLYTLEDLTDATNAALEKMNFPKRSLTEVRSFVGNGIRKLVERSVPAGTGAEALEETFLYFKSYYDAHCRDKTRPYDGIREMLSELKAEGYQMAIVSNKVDDAVQELYREYFQEFVTVAIGDGFAKEDGRDLKRKPAPDMVEEALRILSAKKEEAVYIGDSDVDLQTAANTGIPCVLVLWGFRDKEFLQEKGALVFANTPKEVKDILRTL